MQEEDISAMMAKSSISNSSAASQRNPKKRDSLNLPSTTSILAASPPSSPTTSHPEDTDADAKPQKEPRKCRSFVISTPIRSFHLKAKHYSAMMDWLMVLQKNKRTNIVLTGSIERNVEVHDADAVDLKRDKVTLDYFYSPSSSDKDGGESGGGGNWNSGKTKVFRFKKSSVVIGRSSQSDLALDKDPKVSRNHCRIELTPSNVPVLYDLGSMSGSYVNGKKVTQSPLRSGDKIQLGDSMLIFKVK